MDSLTQIVLGAAVGEAALGKKVGNRAMVWGGIAGTIPDLDVLANGFMSPIDALAFHRGPTHSLLICTLLSLVLGWLIHKMYAQSFHKWFGIAVWSMLALTIASATLFVGDFNVLKVFLVGLFLAFTSTLIYKRYTKTTYYTPVAGIGEWQWLFFLALVTHPILDSFTTYGTQLFWPFSDQRVSLNNIAVADPAYTLPFLACLIVAMCYDKSSPSRQRWNYTGLIISSLYMIFTLYNKHRIDNIFKQSLDAQHVVYDRYLTSPSILNNILWSGVAASDSAYYYGQYSFFDPTPRFLLHKIAKSNADFNTALENDPTLKTLKWFSDGYFVIHPNHNDSVSFHDLRFGTFKTEATDTARFVFKFNLKKNSDGSFYLLDQGETPRDADFRLVFNMLWRRVFGDTSII